MDAGSWERAKEILAEALEIPLGEREVFVRERSGGDGALSDEVLALLAQYDPASDFLEGSPSLGEPDELADLLPGTRVGPYTIVDRIGRGGMGQVFLARDQDLHRRIALKCLLTPAAAAGDERTRILNEAQAAAAINHANVATVYHVIEHGDRLFIVMEYVEGENLEVRLRRERLSIERVVAIGRQLTLALKAAHAHDIIHRDIKPANIQMTFDEKVKVLDFGVARTGHTIRSMAHGGTPPYMSPEQLLGRRLDERSDIFSLGVVLFEMATGRRPFRGNGQTELAESHAKGAPRADAIDSRVPPPLADVIAKAVSIDVGERFQSASEVDWALEAVEQTLRSDSTFVAQRRSIPSVAVLPFTNLGPDQDIEYFCNGLAEDLLTGLGKVKGLRVASRTSSFNLKPAATDIRSLCRQLDVGAILEGTVRKAGDRIRITAQLVSAEDGCHLWSEGYDQRMEDVFAVEDAIARSVIDRLKIALTEFPSRPLIRRFTNNPRAYHSYLKGRFYWSRRYHGGLLAALDQFRLALKEDASYALPYAGLADAYAFLGFYSLQKPREAFAQAVAAAGKALAIEPDLPEAHTSLALVELGHAWNWSNAEREFRLAIALDPSQAAPRIYLSWLLILLGDIAGGIVEARKGQELDPLSPLVNSGVAYMFFLARRYEEAVAECGKSLEVDANFIVAIYVMGMCRAQQSRLVEAVELMERAAAIAGRAPFYLGLLGNFYARAGAVDKVARILDELQSLAAKTYVPPHAFAYVYAGQNDFDRAFEWEAQAFECGASPFNYFSPVIENLHKDPRHLAELRRMGFKSGEPA
jgi:serine/threonine protein kinase/tetratricopeptide (TPR) repeat protein